MEGCSQKRIQHWCHEEIGTTTGRSWHQPYHTWTWMPGRPIRALLSKSWNSGQAHLPCLGCTFLASPWCHSQWVTLCIPWRKPQLKVETVWVATSKYNQERLGCPVQGTNKPWPCHWTIRALRCRLLHRHDRYVFHANTDQQHHPTMPRISIQVLRSMIWTRTYSWRHQKIVQCWDLQFRKDWIGIPAMVELDEDLCCRRYTNRLAQDRSVKFEL